MIEFIKGMLVSSRPEHVVIDTGGVGYGLDISLSTYDALPSKGKECELHTFLYVREDAFRLFGFATVQERDIFEVLLGTSGIGPKLALGILSNMPIDEFAAAIAVKDIPKLTKIPAIGKKTAERLCIELKGKLKGFAAAYSPQEADISQKSPGGGVISDAAAGLISLGVKPALAELAVRKALKSLGDDASVEDLIREGLKHRGG